MDAVLSRNLYLIKEHVGMFKASNNFDLFDPASGLKILECREPNLGFITKMFRFTDLKRNTPFSVEVRTAAGELVVRVARGFTLWRSTVQVFDGQGLLLGKFRQKMLSVGGRFTVLDDQDRELCALQGKWTGWEFRFLAGETELAHVTRKWGGIGKELFTSADNYILEISDKVPPDSPLRGLILGAVMCIDMVLKE